MRSAVNASPSGQVVQSIAQRSPSSSLVTVQTSTASGSPIVKGEIASAQFFLFIEILLFLFENLVAYFYPPPLSHKF